MRSHRRTGLAPLLTALLVPTLVTGCGGADADADGRPHIVATIGMITDAAERIGGDRVRVTGLMGPGIDPHLYKASAGDVRTLSSADLILYNGLHLEAAMADLLRQMDGRTMTRAVTDPIPREELLRPPEFEGAFDPHVWFDVRLWVYAVEAVGEALAGIDPEGEEEFRARVTEYRDELLALDDWVRAEVERVPPERRVLVTAHDAFNYFGRAYDFEVVGLQGLTTVAEAGTGDVQRVTGIVVDRRIPAIFVETSVPHRNIEAVRAAARARGFPVELGGTLFSDAMGDPGTDEGTYPGMVRHNVRTIVEALSREVPPGTGTP